MVGHYLYYETARFFQCVRDKFIILKWKKTYVYENELLILRNCTIKARILVYFSF